MADDFSDLDKRIAEGFRKRCSEPMGLDKDGEIKLYDPGEMPPEPIVRLKDGSEMTVTAYQAMLEAEQEEEEPEEEAEDALDAEWKEQLHPRGQPGNPGQFGPGGGGKEEGPKARQPEFPDLPSSLRREKPQQGAKAPRGSEKAGGAVPAPGELPPAPSGPQSHAAAMYQPPRQTAEQLYAAVPGAAEAVARINAKLAQSVPTDALVTQGGHKLPSGEWTPERVKLHDKIIQQVLSPEVIARAKPKAGEKPTLTVLGGRGGSGKSWLTKEGGPVDTSNAVVSDADHIKSLLPEYEGWNAAVLHEESSDIVKQIDVIAATLGINLVQDATMKSGASTAKRVEIFRKHGYVVDGYYMHASPETAAKRALARFAKNGTFTGRYVPLEIVLSNTENEANFDKLSATFRKWGVYDNNAEGQRQPRPIESSDRPTGQPGAGQAGQPVPRRGV